MHPHMNVGGGGGGGGGYQNFADFGIGIKNDAITATHQKLFLFFFIIELPNCNHRGNYYSCNKYCREH